ncbi:LIP-domain-containing protein [Ceraceosorus guamensis]|uniref:triacylglycerol lipase n=1 Tax=Ceraceosorus guamensis TaxID=1522189 RepID=A0A316VVB1_9BASI|nr:LIP-domain-containing protein [Ceraceosorus guamensis]PWN40868.1 LIP-domain-containing protein [Ceraceosorus guamensis]
MLQPLFVWLGLLAVTIQVSALEGQLHARQLGFTQPLPSKDDFYKPPAGFESKRPGEVLKSRKATIIGNGAFLADSWQVLYRTNTVLDEPDVTVTSILAPRKPSSPPKIVALGIPQDSGAFDCANSYAIRVGSISNAALTSQLFAPEIDAILSRGWYLTIPDFQLSNSSFIIGQTEAHGMIDGVRALLDFKQALPKSDGYTFQFTGYSGGGHAASWAAQELPAYAPELKSQLAGVVSGGIPVSPNNTLSLVNKSFFAGVAGAGVVGFYNAYPQVRQFAKEQGLPNVTHYLEQFKASDGCLINSVIRFPFLDIFSLAKTKGSTPSVEPFKSLLISNLLGAGSGLPNPYIVGVPQYIWHSQIDDVVPPNDALAYAQDQCKNGALIKYDGFAIDGHVQTGLATIPNAVVALQDFFDGKAPAECQFNKNVLPFDLKTTSNYFGAIVAAGLQAAQSKASTLFK